MDEHTTEQEGQLVMVSQEEGPQEMMSREQVELIKRTVAKGTTDDELAIFLHVCKKTGLDPFTRQIHAIKRWNAAEQRESMAIQTGIDGYRLTASRTGEHMGTEDAVFDSEEGDYPGKASVTVYRLRNGQKCAFTASARWLEYVQVKKDGAPTAMWAKMPFLMLGKCAEALALRKAFPAELSSIYTHEEMMQADNEPPTRAVLGTQKPTPIGTASAATQSSDKRLITKGQLEILLLLQRRARVSDEQLTMHIQEHYQCEIKSLLQKDLNNVLEWLETAKQGQEEQQPGQEIKSPLRLGTISDGQRKRIYALCHEMKVSHDDLKTFLANVHLVTSTSEIKTDKYELIYQQIKDGAVQLYFKKGEQDGTPTLSA